MANGSKSSGVVTASKTVSDAPANAAWLARSNPQTVADTSSRAADTDRVNLSWKSGSSKRS